MVKYIYKIEKLLCGFIVIVALFTELQDDANPSNHDLLIVEEYMVVVEYTRTTGVKERKHTSAIRKYADVVKWQTRKI